MADAGAAANADDDAFDDDDNDLEVLGGEIGDNGPAAKIQRTQGQLRELAKNVSRCTLRSILGCARSLRTLTSTLRAARFGAPPARHI